jgi:hypothetical protein
MYIYINIGLVDFLKHYGENSGNVHLKESMADCSDCVDGAFGVVDSIWSHRFFTYTLFKPCWIESYVKHSVTK